MICLLSNAGAVMGATVVDMTSDRDHKQQRWIINGRLNALIQSGRPFTVDEVWAPDDDFEPAWHRSWLGPHVLALKNAKAIKHVGWQMTEMSRPKARPSNQWQGVDATTP